MSLPPRLKRILAWLYRQRWSLLALFGGVLIPLVVFGALAEDVVEREPFFFDESALLFMHGHANPVLDQVMLFFSLLGYRFGVLPLDIGIGLFLLGRRRWGDTLFWILAVGGAGVLNIVAKAFFGRVRPDLWLSLAPETNFSFPSGHAMGSMALVAALVVLTWSTRWRWIVLVVGGLFAFFVGLSRIYLGVHFPSDILAGWAASLSWVLGLSFILYRHATKPKLQTSPA